jgi:hypothetical protein
MGARAGKIKGGGFPVHLPSPAKLSATLLQPESTILSQKIVENLTKLAAQSAEPGFLGRLLRVAAKWRHQQLYHALLKASGGRVLGGSFAVMAFPLAPSEGCSVPKLLGCYEFHLHESLKALVSSDIEEIYDIGCAEGYYAVGFARLFPKTRILAFDINDNARKTCEALAQANGVAAQVEVGRECDWQTLSFAQGKTRLVFCDIEGAERQLLDPSKATGLAHAHIIVECHDCFDAGIADELTRRFTATHHIKRLRDDLPGTRALGSWFEKLPQLDRLIALWEWRTGDTPWLVMQPKA